MSPARTLFYCAIGTMLEWYDFAIFGVLSPTLSKIFFPHQDRLTALILSFAIFATGFIMRPLGGIIIGHVGDRYGRKKAIVISVLLMTIATAAIGLLPVQESTAFMAFLLLSLRLLQGISVGGEYPGIITFSGELGVGGSFFRYLGFASAAVSCGSLLGTVVGALSLLSNNAYAWRFPFLCSVFLGAVGFYLRVKACESPLFNKIKQQEKTFRFPVKEAITKFYKRIIWVTFMYAAGSISFYFVFIYYPSFLHLHDSHHSLNYLFVNIITLSVSIIFTIISGLFTKKKNFSSVMIFCIVGLMISSPAILYLVNQHPSLGLAGQIVLALLFSPYGALFMAVGICAFPTEVRYTCMAIILSLTSIFGGTSPLVATLLVKLTGLAYAPGLYLSLMLLIALIIYLSNRQRVTIED